MHILADRVLILPDAAEQQTATGILIADTVTSTTASWHQGRVVGVGAGHVTDAGLTLPPVVQIGDRVLYNVHAGHELDVLDVLHIVVRENDILGILT